MNILMVNYNFILEKNSLKNLFSIVMRNKVLHFTSN